MARVDRQGHRAYYRAAGAGANRYARAALVRALALLQARKTGTAFWASPGSARQALTGLALRMAISPPIETRFGAIEISLRDGQIGVHVARLVVDEVPMLPGGAVTLDTKASMADDNLVNGGDHQKGYRPKPRSP